MGRRFGPRVASSFAGQRRKVQFLQRVHSLVRVRAGRSVGSFPPISLCRCPGDDGAGTGRDRSRDRAAICVLPEDACAVSVRNFSPGEEATAETDGIICVMRHLSTMSANVSSSWTSFAARLLTDENVPLRQTIHLLLHIARISDGLKTISSRNRPSYLPTRARVLLIS